MEAPTMPYIDRLPQELLQAILLSLFDSFSQSDRLQQQFFLLEKLRPVCRRWNDVVTGTPTFWNVIFLLGLRVFNFDGFKRRIRLSGELGLHVYVQLGHPPYSASMPNGVQVPLEDLQLSRWQLVRLQPFVEPIGATEIETCRTILSHTSQALHTLSYNVAFDFEARVPPTPVLSLPMAASPKSLSLSSCTIDWGSVPLQGLEHLELVGVVGRGMFQALVQFLQRSPNLRTLQLRSLASHCDAGERPPNETMQTKQLRLTKLSTLELANVVQWGGVFLLSVIDAPQLSDLVVDLTREWMDRQNTEHPYYRHSNICLPQLQRLKLGDTDADLGCQSHIITQLLSSSPTLRQIELHGTKYDPNSRYSTSLTEALLILQRPEFKEMWGRVERVASRKCAPRPLWELYQTVQPPSLQVLSIFEADLSPKVRSLSSYVANNYTQDDAEATEKLRALPCFESRMK